MEFLRKYKKYISYCIWGIFLALAFKDLTNLTKYFSLFVSLQLVLTMICDDWFNKYFKFEELKNVKRYGAIYDYRNFGEYLRKELAKDAANRVKNRSNYNFGHSSEGGTRSGGDCGD